MTAVRLTKPWLPLTAAEVEKLRGELGVFQLANAEGDIVRIGYAGGRSLFGLRGELAAALKAGEAACFRVEVTSAYMSRFEELLMVEMADAGVLPAGNAADASRRLGRLSPG